MNKYSSFSANDSNFFCADEDFFSVAPHDPAALLSDGEIDAFMLSLASAPLPATQPAPSASASPLAPDLADDLGQRIQAARDAADALEAKAERMRVSPIVRSAEEQAELDALIATAGLDASDDAPADLAPAMPIDEPWKVAARAYRARGDRKKERTAIGKRERNTAAKRTVRASPKAIAAKRLAALFKATASPNGDKRLEQLRGTEALLVQFRDAMLLAPSASLQNLADIFNRMTGEEITKNAARNRRAMIGKLEAPGGIWHRWK